MIFVVNKWDLMAGDMPTDKWVAYLRDTFRTMAMADRLHHGADGKNVKAMLNHAADVVQAIAAADGSGKAEQTGPRRRGAELAADDGEPPPADLLRHAGRGAAAIVLFCNDVKAISQPYQRYLLGVFREKLGFGKVPIKLYLRRREKSDRRDEESTRRSPSGRRRPRARRKTRRTRTPSGRKRRWGSSGF